MSVERFLRSLHAWLGVIILPWVVIAGFTGIFMNHRELVLSILPNPTYRVVDFDKGLGAVAQTALTAQVRAEAALPGVVLTLTKQGRYETRAVFTFDGGKTDVIVDQATGHYWIVSRYLRTLYAPDGTKIARKVLWAKLLNTLHSRGWLGNAFGSWLADITAGALMVFGISGLYVFTAPRLRRAKNRRARARFVA